jgi:hypothetical protein
MDLNYDQLEVVTLTDSDWVIYDRREEQSAGCGVVGFVTRVAGIYEVLSLANPTAPQFFSTLRSAVNAFVDEAVFA